MMENQASQGVKVTPIAGRNAIKTVAFGVEIGARLSSEVLREIGDKHPTVQNFLPRRLETMATDVHIQTAVGAGSTLVPRPEQVLDSVQFQQFRPDGALAWSFAAQRQYLSVTCSDYSRWATVWKTAADLFSRFVPCVPENFPLAAVGLQYVDQFLIEGNVEAFKLGDVFRKPNDFVAPRVFDLQGLWHSNHGAFEAAGVDGWQTLMNVNISLIPGASTQQRVLQIQSLHRALPVHGEYLVGQLFGETDLLNNLMSFSHERNKSVMAGLLCEDMCNRVGLEA